MCHVIPMAERQRDETRRYGPQWADAQAFWQYEPSALNVNARKVLYEEFEVTYDEAGNKVPRDIYKEQREGLHLTGAESILDVGCGDGRELIEFARKGHKGPLVGINLYEKQFAPAEEEVSNPLDPLPNVKFHKMDARDLHFQPESFDRALAEFLLYHVNDPEEAIRQIKKILKPGGLACFGVRGEWNMYEFWEQQPQICQEAGSEQPAEPFYNQFTIMDTIAAVEREFEIIRYPKPYLVTELNIPLDRWQDVFMAHYSLKDNHVPIPRASHLSAAIDSVAKPAFESEAVVRLEKEGRAYVKMTVQHDWLLARKAS
jgi:SAM-dependent methyltransferase